MSKKLKDINVAVLLCDGFEESEMKKPRDALLAMGATVHLISPNKKVIKSWLNGKWSKKYSVDIHMKCLHLMLATSLLFFANSLLADEVSNKSNIPSTPATPPTLNNFNSPTFSQAPPTQNPNAPAVIPKTTAPIKKPSMTQDPPNDMAIPAAPTSSVNTPSVNPAMPARKSSVQPQSNGVSNMETTPNTDATTESTQKPPSPLPATTPTPSNTQPPPSLTPPHS
jgi:hypothetical protein